VHELPHRRALGAMRAPIDRTVKTRLLADPHAIGYFRGNRATNSAMRTDVLVDGDRCARRGWRTGLRLAHARERKGSQGGEAACGKARAAQKGTTIEMLVRVTGEGGERAAVLFAFGSLDQHGRLLQLG